MDIKQKIKSLAKSQNAKMIAIRRHLHQHPELSYQEQETSAYVKAYLDELGISYTENWAEHGIVASIKGKGKKKSKKKVALRADMDALPILEKNKVPYKSKNPGVMHACGHDVHSTCLLGALSILNETKAHWSGTVQCVFQPGEEQLPGGASIMLKERAFGSKYPDAIVAQHVHPPLEVGKVGFRSGKYMASADEIRLTIKGKGGHAALPQDLIDPIVVAANIITGLQDVVSRVANPAIPSVLSFGKINSDGGATNVIPDKVFLEGTLRTMDETNRAKLQAAISSKAKLIAKASGASCKVDIRHGYPCLINDPKTTETSKSYAIEYLGKSKVVDLPIRLTAEDFAFFSQKMPSCYYRLGTRNEAKGITSPVHTSTFDVDEKCISLGAGLMAYIAVCQLADNTL